MGNTLTWMVGPTRACGRRGSLSNFATHLVRISSNIYIDFSFIWLKWVYAYLSLLLDDLEEICKTFLHLFDFVSIITAVQLELLISQLFSPILLIYYTYCCHLTIKVLFLSLTISILSASSKISFRKIQYLLKGSSHHPHFNLFVNLTEILYNCFAFVNYLERIVSLKLIDECALIVNLSELATYTFFQQLARCS